MWHTVERLWSDATERARRLPEERCTNASTASGLSSRPSGTWSSSPTPGRVARSSTSRVPSTRSALPQTSYAPADATALGIDLGARPSYDEVLRGPRRPAWPRFAGILDGLTDADLGRPCTPAPAPGYPEGDRPVWPNASPVVMEEECDHHRYATRDLAVLEAR